MTDPLASNRTSLLEQIKARPLVSAIAVAAVLGAALQTVQPEIPQVTPAKKPPAWENPAMDRRVAALLKRSCADCHSNETQWPWYSRISPGSWLMADHVRRGRQQLNLSYSWSMDENEKGEIADAVSAGTMPPASYLWVHQGAGLTKADQKLIQDWATDSLGQ